MLLIVVLAAVLSTDPAAFVKSLYEADQRGAADPVYGVKSKESLTRTFEGEIVGLIWRDLVDAMGEVGRMDGHYLYDAQDNEIRNLQIKTAENDGKRARVVSTFELSAEKRKVEFLLANTKNGWRITDILYPGGQSYRKILESDFPPPSVEDERTHMRLCEMYARHKVEVPEGYEPEVDARVLAEMFANGEGVEQDYSAAIHFICLGGDMALMEIYGMLTRVLALERGAVGELDFCDHATSRNAAIICTGERSSEETPDFDNRFNAVHEKWGKALDPLRERADTFIARDAFWEAELSRGGTMYAYAETQATLDRKKKFIELLERLAEKRAPAATDAEVKKVDAALNKAYRERMAQIKPCDPEIEYCGPEVTKETDNLRAAQRAWIPFRDAFSAWYLERWRGAASNEVLRREIITLLTRERITELGDV
jgi:uncharacterized protein YecT (DUF1311 family)